MKDKRPEATEIRVSKIATICLGAVPSSSVSLFEKQEYRLRGRPGLRRCCCGQLPGADPVDVLEGSDHPWRVDTAVMVA